MNAIKIKIGHQGQADKPIYLLRTGEMECGTFRYNGRYKKRFRDLYQKIRELSPGKPIDAVLDVSGCKYWDAVRIYHEYVVPRWCKSISARRIERYANETEIVVLLEQLKSEFKRAVGLKWKKVFKASDVNNPNTPRQAWEIL